MLIFKEPVSERVRVTTLNLDGDPAVISLVHGGLDKAVYVYPSEHYAHWRNELSEANLAWGAFGENLTSEGLVESAVNIGDTLRIGSAEFRVTRPPTPCFKLGIRFGREAWRKCFLHSGKTRVLNLAVTKEGDVTAGDSTALLARDDNMVSLSQMLRVCTLPMRR